ncbi:MAG TPA: hypothetical protein VFB62_13710, partial [Polyangiaceae bacterium]|nr:hypothetical protein [Polyangiaceae bacterium]
MRLEPAELEARVGLATVTRLLEEGSRLPEVARHAVALGKEPTEVVASGHLSGAASLFEEPHRRRQIAGHAVAIFVSEAEVHT